MRSRFPLTAITAVLSVGVFLAAGCEKPVHFPEVSNAEIAGPLQALGAYDTNRDGKADFFTFADEHGRIDRIAYDTGADEDPDQIISLDAVPFALSRHVVLILDGIAFELIREYYDGGGLRMFHPPSKVVAPYPSMTDVSIQDIIGGMPCRAIEALYFDHRRNRLIGGSNDYLDGLNEPYNRLMHYRAAALWDALGYVDPWAVFGKEVNDAKRIFDRSETREMLAYFVSSAGMGTRMGKEGHKMCLRRIEQFVNQVIQETRGLTKVTLLSDHGHTYRPGKRIELEKHLAEKEWKITGTLRGERDVVYVRFGLVTFASFATRLPDQLAADLVTCEGIELASYVEGDAVTVLDANGGRAIIRSDGQRYSYEPRSGDPLKLTETLAGIESIDGYYHGDDLLRASIDHEYPGALERLWRAHFALTQNAPDVIASLCDEYYSGSRSFAGSVNVASTHGGLNRRNSVTFIMSTAGALPPYMRSRDIPRNMKAMTGEDFPMRK